MIRRFIRADLADVRALAREAKRRAVNAWHRNFYASARKHRGVVIVGPGRSGRCGAGYVLNSRDPKRWPDGARLLTIGRVTLAAWGGRTS